MIHIWVSDRLASSPWLVSWDVRLVRFKRGISGRPLIDDRICHRGRQKGVRDVAKGRRHQAATKVKSISRRHESVSARWSGRSVVLAITEPRGSSEGGDRGKG